MSEALIFASTNPQHDNRLFIELQVQYLKIPSSILGRTCCVQKLFLTYRTFFEHNMFSPCSAKRRASDKDLPVRNYCLSKNPSQFSKKTNITTSPPPFYGALCPYNHFISLFFVKLISDRNKGNACRISK